MFGSTSSTTSSLGSFGSTPGAFSSFGSLPSGGFGNQSILGASGTVQAPSGVGAFGYGPGAINSINPQFMKLSQELKELGKAYAETTSDAQQLEGQVGLSTMGSEPNKDCSFKTVCYNLVENGDSRVAYHQCPPYMDKKKWDEALHTNPDCEKLQPTAVIGFNQLQKRMVAQQEHMKILKQSAHKLMQHAQKLDQMGVASTERMEQVRTRQRELSQRLLDIMKKAEVLSSMNFPLQAEERVAGERLESLATVLRRQQTALGELLTSEAQEERPLPSLQDLGQHDLRVLHSALTAQREGLTHLTDIVKRDVRDLEIMRAMSVGGIEPATPLRGSQRN